MVGIRPPEATRMALSEILQVSGTILLEDLPTVLLVWMKLITGLKSETQYSKIKIIS